MSHAKGVTRVMGKLAAAQRKINLQFTSSSKRLQIAGLRSKPLEFFGEPLMKTQND